MALKRSRFGRIITFALLATLLAAVLWKTMSNRQRVEIPYSVFVTEFVDTGKVQSVTFGNDRLDAITQDTTAALRHLRVYLGRMEISADLAKALTERGASVEFRPSADALNAILGALPYLAIVAVIILLLRQMQGAGKRGPFSFGRSPAREVTEDVPSVTFKDVAGAEEAKQELSEIVEFLREPEKFQRLGGRIPRGVLMVGPPGTGKTYLARAVAGEAKVPFYNMSGSDFVEMFVGVGASRVRDLFERATAKAPCIVFIDELDAVGRHRGAGLGGGHDEREQTLNQLLVEMDGFASSLSTVIIMAATNRPDVLDPALLRPGRFDRQVVINLPDMRGREGILRIHSGNVPLARAVDLAAIARGTPGLSGADLKNMVNEAALLAARNNRREVGSAEFEIAKEKVMWGIERRSLVMSDEERRVTAVHEAGHALASIYTDGADPVHKCSIIPRGRALGLTWFLPHEERHTVSRSWCIAKLVGLLGGRAAEELVLNEITNGGSNDIESATALARRMVCEWGMSQRIGPVMMGRKEAEVFIGKELVRADNLSEDSLRAIDEEILRIVEEGLAEARRILSDHRMALDALTGALLEREVLDREAIDDIIRTREVAPRPTGQGPLIVERKASGDVTEQRAPHPRREPARDDAPGGGTDDASSSRRRRRRRRPEEDDPQREEPRRQTPVDESDTPDSPQPEVEDEWEAHREEPDGDNDVRKDRSARSTATVTRENDAPEPVEVSSDDDQPRIVETRQDRAPAVEAVKREIFYGRKPALSRKHALPSSSAPTSGILVKDVVRGDVDYGRGLRPAEDTREQKLMKRALEKEAAKEASQDGSTELPAIELIHDGAEPVEVATLAMGIRTIRRNRKKNLWRLKLTQRNAVARRKRLGTLKLGRRKRK